MDSPIASRMRVAQDANAAAYRRIVQTSAPGDCWDFLILTAANEKQATGYRLELELRHRMAGPAGAFFPAIQKSVVVPDPPGRRAGSGGATLGALRALAEQFRLSAEELGKQRILLIHSGGASQRLPAYSPLGKIFAPLPLLRPDGQISTLFDHLYITLCGLPERLGPGMLVVAGDVFLLLDHRHVIAPPEGVTALSMRVDPETARGHGVFATDSTQRIRQTLQKVSPETMCQAGAMDDRRQVLIDTGLLFFDAQRTRTLAVLAGCAAGGRGKKSRRRILGLHERVGSAIDLYDDITSALAADTQRRQYLSSPATASLRRELWKSLHGTPFRAVQLDGQFLHLGTTRQFRDAMVGRHSSPAAALFQHNLLAGGNWSLKAGRRVYHSALLGRDGGASIGQGSLVEHSILGAGARIGDRSVVSQVVAVRNPLRLGDDLLFFQVPIRTNRGDLRFVQVVCGADDDFKGRLADRKCVYLNRPIDQWLQRHGISPADLWRGIDEDHRTLWTARLFAASQQRDAAPLAAWMTSPNDAARGTVKAWKRSPRYSMAMHLEQADPAALIAHRETVAAHLQAGAMLESLQRGEDRPLERFLGHYGSAAGYEASLGRIMEFAGAPRRPPMAKLQQARAYWCAAQVLQRSDRPAGADFPIDPEQAMRRAFTRIAEASELASTSIDVGDGARVRIRPGVCIEAASPVRLDLAGGWSDTPPYCYERGGHVINVAIDLDGEPPVRATARAIREPRLILETQDLARHVEIRRSRELRTAPNVHDPFALHKVALDMAGLVPPRGADLRRFLAAAGGGLVVSTECRVPKGSGLGTSSILAATLLAALHEVAGRHASHDQLIRETLLLEQRLSTGGGWQDQVGGIVGAVKSTTTLPGLPQKLHVEKLAMSEECLRQFEQRLVVYYSGQQRLARDILRRVMGRWLGREPAVMLLLEELKQSAAELRSALLKGQWARAARPINRYWQIKQQLYPGSTTPTIDVLFLELEGHYLAAGLAGAGGGGFGYFLCRDARQAQRLREKLAEQAAQPGSLGSLFQAQVNRSGLSIRRTTGLAVGKRADSR